MPCSVSVPTPAVVLMMRRAPPPLMVTSRPLPSIVVGAVISSVAETVMTRERGADACRWTRDERAGAHRRTLAHGSISYSTSTIISISTGMPPGSDPMPTAERACFPLSPKISTSRSEQPLMTFG
jgi:hypothetical protein